MIESSNQRPPDRLLKILIVDDHIAIRSALRLELSGHPRWDVCGEAQNGKEAIEKVQMLRPDLVILDIRLPVLNGIETSRELRRIAPDIKILLHSAHDSPLLNAAARDAEADAIANKSEIATSLAIAIEQLAQRKCRV